MKQGTLYAGRIKKAYAKQKKEAPPVDVGETDDPLRRLAVGVLGMHLGDAAGERALRSIFSVMVDWNDVRVSDVVEVIAAMGGATADGRAACQRLISVLQTIYDRENSISLDTLKHKGRREARQYLESMPGVDEYAAASVLLWSLGGHGIPVHDKLLAALRADELVHPEATRAEVQAFLERHIAASEAKTFCLVMESFKPKTKAKSKSRDAVATKSKSTKAAKVVAKKG